MLRIYFENVITRQRKRLEPLDSLKVVGTSLVDGNGVVMGTHQGGLWQLGDEHFFVIGIESPVVIHFENGNHRSEAIGPYHPAWLTGGAVRAGPGQELALARLDETTCTWQLYADRTSWSAVVFTPDGTA